MSFPKNGRVAIVDDQIDQAIPIMNELGKRQCPYLYYSGEMHQLPSENENFNDIRILFLDIHLSGEQVRNQKETRGVLIAVLKRIISVRNFPYIVVYWSRHEEDKELVEGIFESELQDRKPIDFMSANKLDFFSTTGDKNPEYDNNINKLFDVIESLLRSIPVYYNLLDWENKVHYSADNTLEQIYLPIKSKADWINSASNLFNALGKSYSGKQFDTQDVKDKIKSSLATFNYIFTDTLEFKISSDTEKKEEILGSRMAVGSRITQKINSKLLIMNEASEPAYPGSMLECIGNKCDGDYLENVFKSILNYKNLEEEIKNKYPDAGTGERKRMLSSLKADIRSSGIKVWLIITPLCDYVQGKLEFHRIIRGMLILSQYKQLIDDKSEALFISPEFEFNSKSYVFVLHFRNLFSLKTIPDKKSLKLIFRVRQQVVAEIQSKLARHIGRQGILFLG